MLAKIVTRYRTIMMLCVALPFSFIFDRVVWIMKKVEASFKAETKHEDRVKVICNRMKERERLPDPKPLIVNARPSWLSLSTKFYNKKDKFQVPVGDLHHILGWDEEKRTITVEPGVSVRDSTDFLFPKGYSLAVHLEIDDATLGGLVLGVGMTTASHKYGLFFETVVAYEVVLPSGEIARCTKDENSDLFHCLPWSHGSLGILVSLEVQIAPLKKYIEMTYLPIKGQKQYCEKLREECGALNKDATPENLPDFLEMTVFDKDNAVLLVGNMVDEVPEGGSVYHPARWYQPFFFRHVEDVMKKNEAKKEYIPSGEYLLRHQRGIFWVMELTMLPISNHWLCRWLLGWLYPIKPAFSKFTTTDGIRVLTFTKQVFQDITLPMTDLEKSIDLCEECFNIYPLLVYPCKEWKGKGQLRDPKDHQLCPGTDWGMFFDLGIYGIPKAIEDKDYYNPSTSMRKFEQFTRDVGGHPFLYADIFYTEEEFRQCFDLSLYEKVREKYNFNGGFPHLWQKVKPDVDVISIGDQDWGRREC